MTALVCSTGSYGMLLPALGIAQALERAGDAAVVVSGPQARALADAAGLPLCVAPTAAAFDTARWLAPETLAAQYVAVRAAIATHRPAVAVADLFCVGAIAAARHARLPVAVLGIAAYLWPRLGDADEPAALTELRRWRWHGVVDAYRALCAEHSEPLPSRDFAADHPLVGDRLLVRSLPELDGAPATLPRQARFVGACAWRPAGADDDGAAGEAAAAAALAARHPLVFVQQEKRFAGRDLVLDVARNATALGAAMLAVVGARAPAYRTRSSRLRCVAHAPLDAVLARSRAAVTTGHSHAVLAALAAGVPGVIVDHGSGAAEIALGLTRAGVAEHLPGDYDVASLVAAVRRCLEDDARRRRSAEVARRLAAVDGCALAAAHVRELGGASRWWRGAAGRCRW